MILSYSHRFVCLNPPKTGSGHRERVLGPLASVYVESAKHLDCRHWNVEQAKNYILSQGHQPSDFFWFSFFRNPWDRCVSWFNMHVDREWSGCSQQEFKYLIKTLTANPFSSQTPYLDVEYLGQQEEMTGCLQTVADRCNFQLLDRHRVRNYKQSHHNTISHFWEEETIEAVRKWEEPVIKTFGYEATAGWSP